MEKLLMFNSSASRMEPEWLDVMNLSARMSCSIVGIVSSLITVFILSKISSKMCRFDKMIVVLSVNNVLFLINSIVQQFVMRDPGVSKTTSWLLMNYEVALFLSCVMAILVTLSNNTLTSEEMTDNALISLFYAIVVIALVVETALCFSGISNRYFSLIVHFIYFVSVGVLIRHELITCWKLYDKEATCQGTPMGMNIARIFVYNILFTIILFSIFNPSPVLILIRATIFINSLYIMIYLIFSNKKFRMCFLNSVRCRSSNVSGDILIEEDIVTMDS